MTPNEEKLIYQLKILRTLVISSFGNLVALSDGLKKYLPAEQVSRLSGLCHKMKTRGDSVRVLLQTIEDGTVAAPAGIVLVESVIRHVHVIKAELDEAIGQERISEYAEACLMQITNFTPENASQVSKSNNALHSSASRLVHVLKSLAPADVGFYFCVVAACNFAAGIKVDTQGISRIIRELKFPAEYQQAGLSILNYFSVVLDDKYPGMPVEVSIQQQPDRVKLVITLPDGSQDIVEKLLTDYGLVVAGKASPQELMSTQLRALALEQKLEMAQMEVRQTRDLLRLQEEYSTARIESLEEDVGNLYNLLNRELSSKDELQRGFIQLSMQSQNDQLHQQLSLLMEKLGAAIESRDEYNTRVLLEDIKAADPDVFSKISMYLYDAAAAGVIGSYALDWVKVILSAFPK